MNKKFRKLWPVAGVLVVTIITLQFIQAPVQNGPVNGPIQAPEEVTQLFRKACYDCHSNETKLNWYDKIAPVSWLVKHDIEVGRSRFNFSTFDTLSVADQQLRLWEMVNMILANKMPLKSYAVMHPSSRLTSNEVEVLKKYVVSISTSKYQDTTLIEKRKQELADLNSIVKSRTDLPVAANGVKLIPDYRNWQVISTTSRFDNHTMRVIYGNDIMVKAIKSGQVSSFPDGAAIVKVVWNSIEKKSGAVEAGSFNNIQMMIKDDQRFPDSEGWGFARFNGPGLKPYGDSPMFNATCFNCHKASDKTGFVFSLPVENAKGVREVFDAEGQKVTGAFANRKEKTLSLVYGSKQVTFRQADHPSWFGSYINGAVLREQAISAGDQAHRPLVFPR